jgi:hypothetical protein
MRLVPSSAFATAEILQFGCFTWLVAVRLSIADYGGCALRRAAAAGPRACAHVLSRMLCHRASQDNVRGRNDCDRYGRLSPSARTIADPQHDAAEPYRLRTCLPDVGEEPALRNFTEQAVAYYEERAKTGLGMIILGGHLIKGHDLYAARLPSLWNGRSSATGSIRFPSGKPISKSRTSNASTWVRTRGRHRLCERIGRRTSLLATHADDVRGGGSANTLARSRPSRRSRFFWSAG